MAWAVGVLGVSPSWRVRRAALGEWLARHEAAIAAGRALIWVDNACAEQRLNRELAAHHGILLPPPARTTTAIAHELVRRAGFLCESPARAELPAYVGAALAAGGPALDRYARFAARPRTCAALAEMLERLRAEEPDPADWLPRWGGLVAHRRDDLAALAALETAVAGLLDRQGRALPSATCLLAARSVVPGALGPLEAVLVCDTVTLSAADRRLMTALLTGLDVPAAALLPGEAPDPRGLFAPLAPVYEALAAGGLTLQELATPDGPERRVFAPAAGPVAAAVEAVRVPTPPRGLREAFRRIKRWLADGAVRPDEVALLVSGLPALAETIRTVAEEYGVPISLLASCRQMESARTLLARRLLAAAADEFPRRATVDLLAASAFPDAAALDTVSRAAGIVRGAWAVWVGELEQLQRLAELDPDRTGRLPAALVDQALSAARRLATVFAESRPAHPREWRRRLALWLRGVSRRPKDAADDAALLCSLAALEAWPAGATVTAAEYAALADPLLCDDDEADGVQPGTVVVTTTLRRGAGAVRHVLWLNPIDGLLPARPGQSVPLDAHDLEAMGLRVSDGAGWGRDALDFLDAVSAGETLTLLEPAEAGGQPALRSPFVAALARVCVGWSAAKVAAEDRVPAVAEALSPAEHGAAAVLAGVAGRAAALHDTLGRARCAAQVELARRAGRGGRHDGRLAGTAAAAALAERYGPEALLSPSDLEAYHKWPFGFFLDRCLQLDELTEPAGQLDPRVEGTLVHRLLSAALAHGADGDAALAALVEEHLCDERRQPGLAGGLWRRSRRTLPRWCGAVLAAETDAPWPGPCRKRLLEQAFGRDGWPALVLDDGETVVKLAGRIDRLDLTDAGWVVIDYKRSAKGKSGGFNAEPAYQLPLYARAVAANCADRRIAGWALVGYRDPTQTESAGMTPEAITALIEEQVAAVLADARELRAAAFPPWPPPKFGDDARLAAARIAGRVGDEEAEDA